MKIIFLFCSFISLLYGDDPCDGERKTELKFHMEFPHNIFLEKHYTNDGCGYEKTELNLFQNSRFVGGSEAEYGIDILFIGDINGDKKTEVVYTSRKAGYGMNEHGIAVIEPTMNKPFVFDGFTLNLRSFNGGNSRDFISWESPFFCFTSDFCSHGTSLGIQVAKQFKNGSFVFDKEGMNILKKESTFPCNTNVFLEESDALIKFSNNECGKQTLGAIAYDLYIQDPITLTQDLKHFLFESKEAKRKFQQQLINELTKFNIAPESSFNEKVRTVIEQL
jgi:hypothetical protein